MEDLFWILTGSMGVLMTALGFFLKTYFQAVIEKLDALVNKLEMLGETKAIHEQQIKYLQNEQTNIHKRLNEHSSRIRNLEIQNRKN